MKNSNYDWWEDKENKETFPLPISVVKSGNIWTATFNKETEKWLPKGFHSCSQGDTKKEAINEMFKTVSFIYDYLEKCNLKYQRWVPFRHGNWKQTGGTWFAVFGFNFYFRNGKGMKYGWYIPLTKLNISIQNEWNVYRKKYTKVTE